jgi:ABC-2 type transport system permease protein
MGLLLPAVAALVMELAQALPMPVAGRLALPRYAFISLNGLFTSPAQFGPLLTGIAVSLAWAITATMLAYLLFVRRDFTSLAHDGSGRRAITGLGAARDHRRSSAAGRAARRHGRDRGGATGATGSGIELDKVQQSLATAFAHLYRLQSSQLNHMNVTEAQLRVTAACDKGTAWSSPTGQETTSAASTPGISLASMMRPVRPSTSLTPIRTGGPSPTATDRRK